MLNVTRIIEVLDARAVSDTQIHDQFVRLMEHAQSLGKRDLITDEGLLAVFQHPVMERRYMRQVVSWLAEFTPIRVKFKDNGHFEKLSYARKHSGWDIDGLRKASWWEFEKANTTKAAKASIERGLQALARETARAVFENGSPTDTVDEVRNTVQTRLLAMVLEEMSSDKFNAWAEQRGKDMENSKRETKARENKAVAAKVEQLNRLRVA